MPGGCQTVAQQDWGLDWRVRLRLDENDGCGLGCMEGQRGTLDTCLRYEVRVRLGHITWLRCRSCWPTRKWKGTVTGRRSAKHYRGYSKGKFRRRRADLGERLRASVPALHWRADNAAWVDWLRQKIHAPRLPNRNSLRSKSDRSAFGSDLRFNPPSPFLHQKYENVSHLAVRYAQFVSESLH
jgi:hypothetical protein